MSNCSLRLRTLTSFLVRVNNFVEFTVVEVDNAVLAVEKVDSYTDANVSLPRTNDFLASGKSKGLGSFSSNIIARRPEKGRIAEFLPELPLPQMILRLSGLWLEPVSSKINFGF